MKIRLFEDARNKLAVWNDARIVRRDKRSGKYFRDLEERKNREMLEKRAALERGKDAYARRMVAYEIVDAAGNVVAETPEDEETRILREKNLEAERNSAMNLILYGRTSPVELLDDDHVLIDRDEYLRNGLGYLDLWVRALCETERKVKRNRAYYERKVNPKTLDFNLLKLRCELDAAEDLRSIHFMRDIITESMGHDRDVDPIKVSKNEIWVFGRFMKAFEMTRGDKDKVRTTLESGILKGSQLHGYEDFELPELVENLMWFVEEYNVDDLYRCLTFVQDPEKLDYSELYRYHLRYENNSSDLAGKRIADQMKAKLEKMHSGDLM